MKRLLACLPACMMMFNVLGAPESVSTHCMQEHAYVQACACYTHLEWIPFTVLVCFSDLQLFDCLMINLPPSPTYTLTIHCITDRLYFATLRSKPRNSSSCYYFSIDDEFVYEKYVLCVCVCAKYLANHFCQ